MKQPQNVNRMTKIILKRRNLTRHWYSVSKQSRQLCEHNLVFEVDKKGVDFVEFLDDRRTDGLLQVATCLRLEHRLEQRVQGVAVVDAVDVLQREVGDGRRDFVHIKDAVGAGGCREQNVDGQAVAADVGVEANHVRHVWERRLLVRHVDVLQIGANSRSP